MMTSFMKTQHRMGEKNTHLTSLWKTLITTWPGGQNQYCTSTPSWHSAMQICFTSLAFYILNPKAQTKGETAILQMPLDGYLSKYTK